MQKSISDFQAIIKKALNEYAFGEREPKELYEPCDYLLGIGGKRIRPVLCLLGSDLFDGVPENAVKPALAIEYFHNFTLMHDDIMDEAPLRRGHQTVHLKYDLNTGILSGDLLLARAYQFFEELEGEKFKEALKVFTRTTIEICEGQQYDKNFESRETVTFSEYIKMIELKTAVLVGAALQIGAISAGATVENQHKIYEFGKNLGIAFQLQDDYLDVFGNAGFGKTPAGDIIENKKTILYIKAVENANEEDLKSLKKWYALKTDDSAKIKAVKSIFVNSGADKEVQKLIKEFSQTAIEFLNGIEAAENKKQLLRALTAELIQREI